MNEERENKLPSAVPPHELSDLKVTDVKKWAAGVPAVVASVNSLWTE